MRLSFEKRTFPLNSPAITRERTIGPNYAMARDDHRQRIRGAGLCDRPDRARHSNLVGKVLIGCRRSRWYLLQCLPNTLLENGTPNVERQRKARAWFLHQGGHLRDQLVVLMANQVCAREPILKIPCQQCWVFAEQMEQTPRAL